MGLVGLEIVLLVVNHLKLMDVYRFYEKFTNILFSY